MAGVATGLPSPATERIEMAASMVVMLIWIGPSQGGPATIPGFHTIEACEAAQSDVRRGFLAISGYRYDEAVKTKCVELRAR